MKHVDIKILTKNQEKLIISLSRRKKREESGLCICEGVRACTEVYNSRPDLIRYAVVTENIDRGILSKFSDIDIFTFPENRFKRLVSTVNPQNVLFIVEIPACPETSKLSQSKSPFVVVLDRISDPGNLGTIIRTALSVGLDELWCSTGTVDPFSEKTIRSAMGAQFRLRLRDYDTLPQLVEQLRISGYDRIYRTDPVDGESCFETKDLFNKSIIIFGNEALGVEKLENSIPLHISMPGGFESINVAQAVTVILFDAVRRKVL